MNKYHIRLEAIRREQLDRRRLVRALVEAVRAHQRQQVAEEKKEHEAQDEQ